MILTVFLIGMLVFVVLLLFVISSSLIGFLMTRVPFVPTSAKDIEFVVKELGITSQDVFYDLGSGDGKVVFLVNKLSGAKCVGFELTWWTYLLGRLMSYVKGQRLNITFKNQNFFKQGWQEANFVYGYLYPPLMRRVEEKFLADCKTGSIAIIRDFPLPNLKPAVVYNRPGQHEIYVYKK